MPCDTKTCFYFYYFIIISTPINYQATCFFYFKIYFVVLQVGFLKYLVRRTKNKNEALVGK